MAAAKVKVNQEVEGEISTQNHVQMAARGKVKAADVVEGKTDSAQQARHNISLSIKPVSD